MERFNRTLAVVATTLLVAAATVDTASAGCGDFNNDGNVSATDALGVLGAAVGVNTCALARCDVDDSGMVAATDALAVLRSAVGQSLVLACPGVAVTEIGDLPRATGPVVGSNVGAALVVGDSVNATVSQGISIGNLSSDTFGPDSSMAACEIANMTRIALTSAAEADKILCYIQNAFTSANDGTIDIYDGQYHVFALEFVGAGQGGPPGQGNVGGPSVVKMRLERSGETITGFEMFACEDTGSGSQQNEYISQTISSSDFSMTAKGMFSDPFGGSDAHQVHVSGDLNDAGQFVGTKTITLSHSGQWSDGGSGYGEMVVGQGSDLISVDGYDAGTFRDGQEDYLYSNRVTALADLYDFNTPGTNYSLGQLALGDGAAKVSMRHGTQLAWSDFTEVQGWNGETTAVDLDAAADFVDIVLGADLVETGEVNIVFTPEETFDCSEAAEAVVPIDMMALDAACNDLDMDQQWIDCFSLLNSNNAGGGATDPGAGLDPACIDPGCTCDLNDPVCLDSCWDYINCGDPNGGGTPNTGGLDPACIDPSCTCDLNDPVCLDSCWDYVNCGDPNGGGTPNTGGLDPACIDPSCTCDLGDPVCVDSCWDYINCGDPNGGGTPSAGGPDAAKCIDPACTCDLNDPACVDSCWDFATCGDPGGVGNPGGF